MAKSPYSSGRVPPRWRGAFYGWVEVVAWEGQPARDTLCPFCTAPRTSSSRRYCRSYRKTKQGTVGTISISFGTTAKGREWTIGADKGSVSVNFDGVTIDDKVEEVANEGSGVVPEVRAWGEALAAGTVNEKQSPEEALADLELIEAMLVSGSQDGKPFKLEHQEV